MDRRRLTYKHLALPLVAFILSSCSSTHYQAGRTQPDGPAVDSPATNTRSSASIANTDSLDTIDTVVPEYNEIQESTSSTPTATSTPRTASTVTQPKENTAIISTKFGDIVVQLHEDAAPLTVANFKKLASEGFYNGTTFHRVIPGFMIQGGDPLSKDPDARARHGTGGPGYTIPAEIKLSHKRGALACARLGDSVNPKKESSGSQFFICVVDTPHLDGQYTVFGQVISGMEALDKIVNQKRDSRDNPIDRVEMTVSVP